MSSKTGCAAILAALLAFEGSVAYAIAANLFPNSTFDMFDGDLPEGWTSEIWNQPMVNERIHRLCPGRDGSGYCLEIEPTTPMTVMSLTSPSFSISTNRNFLFKGYYASTCQGVTTDKRWKNAEGVSLSGKWLDAETNTVNSFTIVLPDTQDRWLEFFREVHAPETAHALQIVISRRWIGGRLRFDDFTLREGTIRDYREEFSIRQVPDESFFPIFGWLIPGLSSTQKPESNIDSDHHHALYALANFNLGNKAVFGLKRWLDRFEPKDDADLAAVAEDATVWGFHWGDEPGEDAFPKIAEIHERFRRLVPSKPFWVNLLPTYGFESLEAYDHYIKGYIDTVKPTMFTYDHYCMVGKDPYLHANGWYSPNREGSYFSNLEIVRKHALTAGIEFGVIVSVGTFGPVRGASEAELRWQAFTTLAYGARSLGWFCYLTEVNDGHWTNWEDMIINRDGTRTRHYSMVKYLNGEILNWGPTLLKLTSTGVYHTQPLPILARPLMDSKLVKSVSGGMCLIGEFKHKDAGSYLMIVNRDFIHPLSAQINFRDTPKTLFEVSRQTGDKETSAGYKSNTRVLNVQLAAGDARLFCLEF